MFTWMAGSSPAMTKNRKMGREEINRYRYRAARFIKKIKKYLPKTDSLIYDIQNFIKDKP